jgi:ABC-2 type transport system ATP-binding protein
VTSHILGEIERIADRVAILLGGRLLAVHTLRTGGARRRLQLQVRGNDDLVRRCLDRVRGVLSVAPAGASGDGTWTYVLDVDGPSVSSEVAAALVGAGLALVELHERAVDLESLFLALTGGAVRTSPTAAA